jgi:hypothetical protein
VQVKNTATGEMVDITDADFSLAIKKPLAIRYKRLDFPFEVETLEGTMSSKPEGGVLIIGIQDEAYPCETSIFNASYEDIEFATPKFRDMSRGDFVKLAIRRGAKPTDAGRAIQIVEDIKQLTDGKKPVYVVEMTPDAQDGDIELFHYMCVATNLAVLLVPMGEVNVLGEVE